MSDLREAAQQALRVMQTNAYAVADVAPHLDVMLYYETIGALADALSAEHGEQPDQEPVAHLIEYNNGEKELRFQPSGWGDKVTPLYAMPQLREAQKPVAWLTDRQEMYFDREDARRYCNGSVQPLYTHPPSQRSENLKSREWRGLTEEEIDALIWHPNGKTLNTNIEYARAIEAALKERNA